MKTEPNQSLQTISRSVTVAAEPLCVPPHEMSDLKRSAKIMTAKKKVAVTAIGACLGFALCMAIDYTFREQGSGLTSLLLFPASYLVLISILLHIGDIKGLFDYAWIFHAVQFAIYGFIFARFWILDRRRKGAILLIITHLVMIIIYLGRALLHQHYRI